MDEPRISLLAGDAGRTFASMGLVVIRESKAFFERVVSAPPKEGRRDFEVVNAWEHELVHFLHSISTSYMYSHAVSTIKYAFNVLDNFQAYLEVKDKRTQFEDIVHSLDASVNGISTRDILEGVAVLDSFKLADPEPDPSRFLSYRDTFFPGHSDSCYRRTFDYLAHETDAATAYHILAPMSFMALQGDSPPTSLGVLVEEWLPNLSWDGLLRADVPGFFAQFGMDVSFHFLNRLGSVPDNMRHPVLLPCAQAAVRSLGSEVLMEIAARPSWLRAKELTVGSIQPLLPPLVAFSSTPRAKLEGATYGLANEDPELASLIVHTVALIGAVERLTVYRESSSLYQFCPHEDDCPHYESALCFNYFSPPSMELGYEKCGFVRLFRSRTGMEPVEAWARVQA